MQTVTRAVYQVSASDGLLKNCPQLALGLAQRFGLSGGKAVVTVLLSSTRIEWIFGDSKGPRLNLDLVTGERVFLNPSRKEYLRLDHGPEVLTATEEGDSAAVPARTGQRQHVTVGRSRLSAERYQLTAHARVVDLWCATGETTLASATRALWRFLLPGARPSAEMGLPVTIHLRDDNGQKSAALQVTLVDLERAYEAEEFRTPADYTAVAPTGGAESKGGTLRVRKRLERPIAGARLSAETLRQSGRLFDVRPGLLGVLGATGDDVALVTDQPVLDQLRGTLNAVSHTFGTFKGDGDGGDEPMHLVVDWWQQLEPHLQFPDTEGVVRSIKQLWLAYAVMGAQPIEGLSEEEAAVYDHAIVNGAAIDPVVRDRFGLEAARYLAFAPLFESRLAALEDIRFAKLTSPVRLDFEIKKHRQEILEMLDCRLWDFDTEVSIDGSDIIEELKFGAGRLDLVLKLKQLRVDFQFSTAPTGSAWSIIIGLLTLGGSTLLQTNYGWGYFNIDDAKVPIRIMPEQSGTITVLRARVDEDDADLDSSAFVFGVNLVQDVLDALIAAVVSWGNLANEKILGTTAAAVDKLVQAEVVHWPCIWNATRGPAVVSAGAAHVFRAVKGVLASPVRDIARSGSAADFAKVSPFGYACSKQFLTAWAREIIGSYAEERVTDVDWEGRFGITFPDPAQYAVPPDAATDLRAMWETARYYRTRIVRRPPIVTFLRQGSTDRAGRIKCFCDVYVEAVATFRRTDTVVTPGRVRCFDSTQLPGAILPGIGGRPGVEPPGSRVGPDPRPDMASAAAAGTWVSGNPRTYGYPLTGPRGVGGGSAWGGVEHAGLGSTVCLQELPTTTTTSVTRDCVLHRLLAATICVSTDIVLGFNAFGNPWLPEICLTLFRKNGSAPTYETEATGLETEDPFDGTDRSELRAFCADLASRDGQSILSILDRRDDYWPESVRQLIPMVAAFLSPPPPQEVFELLVFRQRGSTDPNAFSYLIDGSLLYWPLEITGNLAEHIA